MKVVLVHAYSTTNSGDGLLVEEARDIALRAYPSAEIALVALDPGSFDKSDYSEILHALTGTQLTPNVKRVVLSGLRALVWGRKNPAVERLLAEAEVVLAVGGGYLRAKNPVEAMKMMVAHGPQLPRTPAPIFYLPQSIGPLRYGSQSLINRRLPNARAVFVRDDRSAATLAHLPNVYRSPDMALLGLPEAFTSTSIDPRGSNAALVARELPGNRKQQKKYLTRIGALLDTFPDMELLVQASARGNDDATFYTRHFGGRSKNLRSLKHAVNASAENRPGVVVSVRLHGAIESIRSGVPSVHLSYERKGWGAFSDLGIQDYVHNVYDFDIDIVRNQVHSLLEQPASYWQAVQHSIPRMEVARGEIVDRMARETDTSAS